MLTLDLVAEALLDLERGRLPDETARLHLCSTLRRALAGAPWSWAVGSAGSLALAQRNRALRAAARWLDPGDERPWILAGRLREALARAETRGLREAPPELQEHLDDALRLGAGALCRDALYRILRDGS